MKPAGLLHSRRRERGIVLVLVLWMLVVLSLIAYSLLFQVTMETSMTSARKKQMSAEALARAGAGKAIIDLRNDLLWDHVDEREQFDAEGDIWARPEEDKEEFHLADEVFSGDEEDGYFSVRVYDEEGFLNLNEMDHSSRDLLTSIIEEIGYNEEDAELTATAIVDWRDSDLQSGISSSPHPEEGIAYAVLRGEDLGTEDDPDEVQPMVFRNEDYLTTAELLEVYGVTPDLYFGPGTREAEYYNKIMGRSREYESDRFEIENDRRRDDEEVYGLRDYFTVYGSGTLNVNTAPEHVLNAMAIATGQGDDSFGERVLKIRRGGQRDDLDNDDAFESMQEVMSQGEIAGVLASARNFHPIGVQSTTFRIVSYGVVGEIRNRFELLVHREILRLVRDESFEYTDRAEERRDLYEGRFERRENEENELRVNLPHVQIIQVLKD